MKKTLLLSTLLAGSLLIFKPADAQFRVRVNINPFPSERHTDYYDYGHRINEVILNNDHGNRHDGYRDRGDFDNRDWRRNDDNRRHNDNRYGRNDNDHGRDEHHDRKDDYRHSDNHGRGKW